jgi:hypothetical protein
MSETERPVLATSRQAEGPVTLPSGVADVADLLAGLSGVAAVVLGGSRGLGCSDAASDWDLGVYYRGELDWRPLERLGAVHPPGSWGRVMNGGAWLALDGLKVDVLFRELSFVEQCTARALDGSYDVDALLGYVAGVPTYSVMAEAATCVVLRGALDAPRCFPEKLAERAPPRWRLHRDFSLQYARGLAIRGDWVPALGQLARAVLEEGHARVCACRIWTLNEKRLVESAGLAGAQAWLLRRPADPAGIGSWLAEGERLLSTQA